MDTKTQYWQVKRRLADHAWHSIIELNSLSYRFSARIYELRKVGFEIIRREKRVGRERHIQYRMLP